MISITVRGKPTSVQKSGRADRWKDSIRSRVPASIEVMDGPVKLLIIYVFNGEAHPDLDNIIKPIADALSDIVYLDDRQVVDPQVAKYPFEDVLDLPRGDLPDAVPEEVNREPHDFVYIQAMSASGKVRFS